MGNDLKFISQRNLVNLDKYFAKKDEFFIAPDLRTSEQKRLGAKLINRKEKLLRMGLQSG